MTVEMDEDEDFDIDDEDDVEEGFNVRRSWSQDLKLNIATSGTKSKGSGVKQFYITSANGSLTLAIIQVKDNHVENFEVLKLSTEGGYELWVIMVPNIKRQERRALRSRTRQRSFNEEGKELVNDYDDGVDGENDNSTHDLDEEHKGDSEHHESTDVQMFSEIMRNIIIPAMVDKSKRTYPPTTSPKRSPTRKKKTKVCKKTIRTIRNTYIG
jgi:pullulanase/glycogen debranching enzyme